MPYTLTEAAKAIGRTKATLQEAIKKGRVSAAKDELGRYQIDPAELHRVYPLIKLPDGRQQPEPDAASDPLAPSPSAEIRRLNDKIESLERLCSQIESERNGLREDRDHWRRQATALLTRQQEAQAAPTFWDWWRGLWRIERIG